MGKARAVPMQICVQQPWQRQHSLALACSPFGPAWQAWGGPMLPAQVQDVGWVPEYSSGYGSLPKTHGCRQMHDSNTAMYEGYELEPASAMQSGQGYSSEHVTASLMPLVLSAAFCIEAKHLPLHNVQGLQLQ